MAAAEENFFASDSPHGLAKRIMYKKYIQAYIPIMLSTFPKITILDGFAGVGRYGDEWPHEIEKYGSPIITLRVAIDYLAKTTLDLKNLKPEKVTIPSLKNISKSKQKICSKDDECRLNLIFVESKKKYFKQLVTNMLIILDAYGIQPAVKQEGCMCTIQTQDERFPIFFQVYYAEFTQMIAPPAPCLAFLDPFGYTQTPMSVVRDFVGHRREVFINFMSGFITRFIGQHPKRVAECFTVETPDAKDDDELVHGLQAMSIDAKDADTDTDTIDNFVTTFTDCLKKQGDTKFALTFEMRNKQNRRIYHLVFVTNHIKGLEVMKESMNRASQEHGKNALSDFKIIRKGIPFSLANDQDNDVIASAIYQHFKGGKNIPICDIEEYVLMDTPFVYRKNPLKILENDGKITAVFPNLNRRKGTFPDRTEWRLTFATDES